MRGAWVWRWAVVGGLLVLAGCGGRGGSGGVRWDSAGMVVLVNDIRTKVDRQSNDPIMRPWEMAGEALEKNVAEGDVAGFVESFGTFPDEPSDEQEVLLQATVEFLCRKPSRHRHLSRLLAMQCPTFIGFCELEDYLAMTLPLPDAVLAMTEAFSRSKSAEAREMLALCLRRAFEAHGIVDSDDAKLVEKCRAWFMKNLDRLEVVHEYGGGRSHKLVPLYIIRGTVIDRTYEWGGGPKSRFADH